MVRLALLAVLLMVSMPSVSRLTAMRSAQDADARGPLCTAQGLKWLGTGEIAGRGETPGDPSGDDADCSYCTLAHTVSLAPSWSLPAFLPSAVGHIDVPSPPRLRSVANRRGLGSRGPPTQV